MTQGVDIWENEFPAFQHNHKISTDQFMTQNLASGLTTSNWNSGLSTSTSCASTLTLKDSSCMANTSSTHIFRQLSGEWQNMYVPAASVRVRGGASTRRPFVGRAPCWPNIIDPGRRTSRVERRWASRSCCASEKRWKREDV